MRETLKCQDQQKKGTTNVNKKKCKKLPLIFVDDLRNF